mgnify:CR=1 FL=1
MGLGYQDYTKLLASECFIMLERIDLNCFIEGKEDNETWNLIVIEIRLFVRFLVSMCIVNQAMC